MLTVRKQFDYGRPLLPGESHVALVFADSVDPEILSAVERKIEAHNISLSVFDSLPTTRPTGAILYHLIVLTQRAYDAALVERLAATLEVVDSASVAFEYQNAQDMLSAAGPIELDKIRTSDRINFLRPDIDHPTCRVSAGKIAENVVCDSVRIKYRPHQISSKVPTSILESTREFFEEASSMYSSLRLFHRSPTDGYFAARTEAGIAITATKTDKVSFDYNRVSLIHAYDQQSNTLHFSGPYLPSSDAVEGSILFSLRPALTTIIHTHASLRFTRNPSYADRVLVPRLPYGEPELGFAVSRALDAVGDGFVIMDDHGEVFACHAADLMLGIAHLGSFCAGG
jgi:hypothetical protein